MDNENINSSKKEPQEQADSIAHAHVEKLYALTEAIIEDKIKNLHQKQVAIEQEDQKKGKNLSSFLETMSYFSNQASSVNRSLALAGIAIIWIFKKPEGAPPIPEVFNFELWCLAASLGLDLLQYTFGAFAWYIFYEVKYANWKRNGYPPDYAKDIKAPNAISLTITALFLFKIIFMGIAYWNLLRCLYAIFHGVEVAKCGC